MKWISNFSTRMDKYMIHIVNLISLLFIFRGSIPAFKYPFIVLYALALVNLIFIKKVKMADVKLFIKTYLLIIVLVIIFSVALFHTYKLYLEIFKELINTTVLLSIAFFYTLIINSEKQLRIALNNLIDWVIPLSTVIAVIWIYDFISIYLPGNNGMRLLDHQVLDYNFATIPALFGLVSISFILPQTISKLKQYRLTFLLLLLYLQLFLSSSRRCFIIANSILIVIYILFVVSLFVKKDWISKFGRSIRPFLLIFTVAFLSGFYFITKTTFDYKTALFKNFGISNGVGLTNEITEKYLRFVNIFDPEKNMTDLFQEVWKPNLDAKNPDSGWGKRIHKIIFPLSGENANLIPTGVKGYYMDNTCDAYVFGGNSYSITNVDMEQHIVLENDTIKSSIFCFVSDDYDGDWVFSIVADNEGKWVGYAYYDLKKKGVWQELTILLPLSAGHVSTNIYFVKNGASSFSDLKGHVIFAFPQFTNISQTKRVSVDKTKSTSAAGKSSLINYKQDSAFSYNCLNIPLTASFISPLSLITRIPHGDPIRKLMIRLFPKDTSYLPYKSNLQVHTISYKRGDERILRWQFAWQIFKSEYNWKQKLFGGGFSFLNWYGYYFAKDKNEEDWPHNPFMSILLYSGIVGLLLYCFFLYKVFYYYIKYIKEYPVLFIFFLITFFFSFFSGDSPFDPPMMGFFVILPFFIHSVHKKDAALKENSRNSDE